MGANLSWGDWWRIFSALSDEQKVLTWEMNFGTLDSWRDYIASKSDDVQIEILRDAPRKLILKTAPGTCLRPNTRRELSLKRYNR